MEDFRIVSHGDGEFEAQVRVGDGTESITLLLAEAEASSDGRLPGDEATARATIRYLLEHQEAADLPGLMDIEEVLAAYEDATDRIVALRE